MLNITELLITNNRPYIKIIPQGAVIHWTANTDVGADALANRNYFQNHPEDEVSAHYIVDDKSIIRCIPENEMAWHVGAKKYTDLKYELFGNANPNNFLIGIEMCINSDGDWSKTYQYTVELVVDILKRYGWGVDRIYRHFDITNKDCPRMMTPFVDGGEEAWEKFKEDVLKGMNSLATEISVVNIKAGEKVVKAMNIDGKTFCPVRELAEALGKVVEWNGKENIVEIK